MIKTISAGGIVLNLKGEVAVVRNGSGLPWWGFPKGHVNEGEELIDAAKREILEETGISDLAYMKDLGSYERHKGKPGGGEDSSELKTIHMFLFKTSQQNLEPQDEQNPEACWVSVEEATQMLTHPKDRAFFLAAKVSQPV